MQYNSLISYCRLLILHCTPKARQQGNNDENPKFSSASPLLGILLFFFLGPSPFLFHSFLGLFLLLPKLVFMGFDDAVDDGVGDFVLETVFFAGNEELVFHVDVMLSAGNGRDPRRVNRSFRRFDADRPTGAAPKHLDALVGREEDKKERK